MVVRSRTSRKMTSLFTTYVYLPSDISSGVPGISPWFCPSLTNYTLRAQRKTTADCLLVIYLPSFLFVIKPQLFTIASLLHHLTPLIPFSFYLRHSVKLSLSGQRLSSFSTPLAILGFSTAIPRLLQSIKDTFITFSRRQFVRALDICLPILLQFYQPFAVFQNSPLILYLRQFQPTTNFFALPPA